MILRENHELFCRELAGRVAVATFSIERIVAGVDEPLSKRFDKMVKLAEVLVVTGVFIGKKGMKGVMKIVIPLTV